MLAVGWAMCVWDGATRSLQKKVGERNGPCWTLEKPAEQGLEAVGVGERSVEERNEVASSSSSSRSSSEQAMLDVQG